MQRCWICTEEKAETYFLPRQKGEAESKSYCSTCKEIYLGIYRNLIPVDEYVGKNFDYMSLEGDREGKIIVLYEKTYDSIPVNEAVRFIKQGAAHVTSVSTIKSFAESKANAVGVSATLRSMVYERDDERCRYCGKPGNTLDHVIPQSKGGMHTLLNLVCACEKCNAGKGSKALEQFFKEDVRRMSVFGENRSALKKNSMLIPQVAAEQRKLPGAGKIRSCSICKTPHDSSLFNKSATNCMVCERYEAAISKGWLTVDKLMSIKVSKKTIKGAYILAESVDGSVHLLKKSEAKYYLHKGLAEVLDSCNIRFLFTYEQMNELNPVERPPIDLAVGRFNSLLKGPQIAVYSDNVCKAVVGKGEAKKLILDRSAKVLAQNRIQLTVDAKKAEIVPMVQKMSKKESQKRKLHMIYSDVSVFTEKEGYVGVMSRNHAMQLLTERKASVLKTNRILVSQENIRFAKNHMHNVAIKKLQIKGLQGNIIGAIPVSMMKEIEHLVVNKLAVKENDQLFALKKSIDQIKDKHPELKLLTMLKKKEIVTC